MKVTIVGLVEEITWIISATVEGVNEKLKVQYLIGLRLFSWDSVVVINWDYKDKLVVDVY